VTIGDAERISSIKTFPSLVKYLRDELDWPIEPTDIDELTFDYDPEELGLNAKHAAKIREIKQLRPLETGQPWGIFWVNFEKKRLPMVVLRRILGNLIIKSRAGARKADRPSWHLHDLLFISSYGEAEHRTISFAYFTENPEAHELPVLRVLGWDDQNSIMHLDRVANRLRSNLRWPDDPTDTEAWRDRWSEAFTDRYREAIRSADDLIPRLADLATNTRHRVRAVLDAETDRGLMRRLFAAVRELLIHDMNEDAFADMYAQTVAYGLLSASFSRPGGLTAQNLVQLTAVSNPFLENLLENLFRLNRGKFHFDVDEVGINDVLDLLRNTNIEAIKAAFSDRNPAEDPVIRFYEGFLKQYDPGQRIRRGVFFTPRPIVSYIVRSVHELIQSEFGLPEGLASTATWADMKKRFPDLTIPKGAKPSDTFVCILDPAVGTGTFLFECIEVIERTIKDKWCRELGKPTWDDPEIRRRWREYVPKHLLTRLYGYELMMAPYAIAHLKLALKLGETGYQFREGDRLHIYLTNSLEPLSDVAHPKLADLFTALAHEAQAVNAIKRRQRFTVIMGNPPYSLLSSNMEPHHRELVAPYKLLQGQRIHERSALQLEKNLNDDYVKFVRIGQLSIDQAGVGVFGLVTNHSFLDNPTMRGMRWSLMHSASSIWVNDLHGNSTKREQPPDGAEDVNVFSIKQGVAITLLARLPNPRRNCEVRHHERWGTRESKETWLATNHVGSCKWNELEPTSDLYLFVPQSTSVKNEYGAYLSLPDVMTVSGAGYITARDNLVIDFERDALVERIRRFSTSKLEDDALLEAFQVPNKKGWDVARARRRLKQVDIPKRVIRTNYRPFDFRWIFFDSTLVWGRSWPTMQHVADHPENLTLLATRMTKDQWDVWVARTVSSHKAMSAYDTNSVFPLYLYDDAESSQKGLTGTARTSLSRSFLKALASSLRIEQKGPHGLPEGLTPEDVFHHAYAVFRSPGYRRRYAEFLKIDFPRLPLTRNLDLFRALSRLGCELVALHLLESPKLDDLITTYTGPKDPKVGRVGWSDDTVWLDAPATRRGRPSQPGTIGFRGVPEQVWNFHIGGHQVCQKWLKDRKGRQLTADDIAHYEKIVIALNETIRLMAEIDKVIEEHGGWPDAFAARAES